MKPMVELWAPVLLNGGIFKDNYLVSNMGRVRQKRFNRDGSYRFILMKIIQGKRPMIKMVGGGKEYHKSLAKLVLSSFNYREGCECANITYLDGNMHNCVLSNLRYTADKMVYTNIELKKMEKESKLLLINNDVKAIVKPVKKLVIKDEVKPSCSNCAKRPCMNGQNNLSTDFGAIGCNDYKPE